MRKFNLLNLIAVVMLTATFAYAEEKSGEPKESAPKEAMSKEVVPSVDADYSNFEDGALFMPKNASNHVGEVDWIFDVQNIITAFFFVLIIFVMVLFCIKYRRKDDSEKPEKTSSHNTALELAWSLPPLIIVMWLFVVGFVGFSTMATPPEDAYTIEVVAKQWDWTFIYPNGYYDTNLHVPAGKPVVLKMRTPVNLTGENPTADVIHSLWIPAFRVKQDVVPGRVTQLWFTATKETKYADDEGIKKGEAATARGIANGFRLYCTEFCGTNHSKMTAMVVVHKSDWEPPEPVMKTGKDLFVFKKCSNCHQLPGESPTGVRAPSFAKGIFGKQEKLTTGETITVDEAYLRESIIDPGAKIVFGYPQMGPQGVNEEELKELVRYLSTLKYKE